MLDPLIKEFCRYQTATNIPRPSATNIPRNGSGSIFAWPVVAQRGGGGSLHTLCPACYSPGLAGLFVFVGPSVPVWDRRVFPC